MTADSASPSSRRRRHRGRRLSVVVALPPLPLLLLLPLLLATFTAADKGAASSPGPEICLESDGAARASPLLMLDWTEEAPVIGCSCELLSMENDPNDQAPPPPLLAVGPGDSRVFRLLQPSARLACSPQCGRVAVSAVGGAEEWVPAQTGVVGFAGATVRVGGCGGKAATTARAFFSSGGAFGGDTAAVHALRLRATKVGGQGVTVPTKDATLPRAAAALLFVGLNAAAAALSSSSSSSR